MFSGSNRSRQPPFRGPQPPSRGPPPSFRGPQRPPPPPPPPRQTSFPELVGRSAQEAVSFISARGLTPVLVRPNQPMTMDFREDRVRIVTDPSGRVVAQTPTVG